MAFSFGAPLREAGERFHGPRGYSDYRRYKDWLRDEFAFRCVWCLTREVWTGSTKHFHVEHHEPRALGGAETDYDNLYYACGRCNYAKGATPLPVEPETFWSRTRVADDGHLVTECVDCSEVVLILHLNSTEALTHRQRFLQLWHEDRGHPLFAFPSELPDLRRKNCTNQKRENVDCSYRAMRERDELPDAY
ncbi:MAG: HNH endonuclease [Planctomycetota bacterium]